MTKDRLLKEIQQLPGNMIATIRHFAAEKDMEETTKPGDTFRTYGPTGNFHVMIKIEIEGELKQPDQP